MQDAAKQIACDTGGIYEHVEDGGDLSQAMAFFYRFATPPPSLPNRPFQPLSLIGLLFDISPVYVGMALLWARVGEDWVAVCH